MATPAAILSVLVEAKGIRSTTTDLHKVDRAGNKAAAGMSKFQKVAGVGILAVGAAAASAGPKLISLASDAEETASKFKIVFGKETKDAIKQLDEFSKATGTSRFALREQAAGLQALVKPMGVAGKASSKMSVGLTKLATDLASFNNTSVQDAIVALQSGLVGEAEPLRKFAVQLSEVRVKAFAYAHGIAQQGKELTTAEKAQARYGIILKDTRLAQGDAERTSGSYANQLKRLKATVTDAATELGVKLLPAATAVTAGITKFLGELRSGEGVGGRVASVFSGITGTLRDLFTGFREGASGARDLATGLGFIAGAFVAVKVVEGLRTAIAGLSVVMTKNPIGLAAAAIGGLAAAIGIMRIGVQDATADSRAFNDALRAQADALRAVRDIDIEVAQRKANLKSANVAVETSEKRLYDLRKSGKASTLELEQAEADLEQAKVGQKRANRELARSEEDSTRKKEDAKVATENLTKAEKDTNREVDRAIDKKRDYISALGRAIEEQTRYGGNTKETRDNVKALRDRQRELNNEINALKSNKVDVGVTFKLNPAPGSTYGSQGDGWGVKNSVQKLAQRSVDAGKLFGPGSFGNAGIGGTGLNAFNHIATNFGLTVGSGFRPGSITLSGNLSYHAMGRARDFPGSPSAMMAFAQFMAANFGGKLKELIHTPLGFSIKNGARVAPYAQADHYDHVHVAMRRGGEVPGSGPGDKIPAMLESGEFVVRKKIVDKFGPTFFAGLNGMAGGGIVGAAKAAKAAGFKGQALINAVAIAGAESGYNPGAQNLKYPDHSIGLWQINQLAHKGRFGSDSALKNPMTNARAAFDLWRESGFGPWSTWPGAAQGYMARAAKVVADLTGANKKSAKSKPKNYVKTRSGAIGKKTRAAMKQLAKAVKPGTKTAADRALLAGLEAQQDLAALTAGTGDDLAVGDQLVTYWQNRLARAQKNGVPAGISEAAQGLQSARSFVGGIRQEEADRLAEAIERQNELQEQVNANQLKILALAGQGDQIVGAVVAAVNGGIGGRVGLGFHGIRSTPGSVANL